MTQAPPWAAPFIGAPYCDDGKTPGAYNCWTLYRAALQAGFAVAIDDYDGPVWSGRQGVAAMAAAAEAFARRFDQIATGAEWRAGQGGREAPGDAVLLRLAGAPIHIGIVTTRGFMLHIDKDAIAAHIEPYTGAVWRCRVVAFYRPTPR